MPAEASPAVRPLPSGASRPRCAASSRRIPHTAGRAQRPKDGKTRSVFKPLERRRGAGRREWASTPAGHGLGHGWAGDSPTRGCDAVGGDCRNWRTRLIRQVGAARRTRSGDRDIRPGSSARFARPRRGHLAPGAGSARRRRPDSPAAGQSPRHRQHPGRG